MVFVIFTCAFLSSYVYCPSYECLNTSSKRKSPGHDLWHQARCLKYIALRVIFLHMTGICSAYIAVTLPKMALKVIFPQAIGINQSAGEENTRHIDPSPSIRELMVLGL